MLYNHIFPSFFSTETNSEDEVFNHVHVQCMSMTNNDNTSTSSSAFNELQKVQITGDLLEDKIFQRLFSKIAQNRQNLWSH